MKGKLYLCLIASVALIFLVLAYVLVQLSPVALPAYSREIVVSIPNNATAGDISGILRQKEVIRSALLFRLYARWKGLDGSIKAGEYKISNGFSTPRILLELVSGRVAVQTFTVPEGYTTAQIADLLVSKGLAKRDRFFSAVANGDFSYSFLKDAPPGNRRLEGYLFPDTYQVTRGSDERTVIDLMLRRFEREIKELNYTEQAGRAGLSLHQAVTIASMVEREARIDDERPVIAGVILNRLEKSMLLQIDATVQYALGAQKPKLYYKDLEINSPYNTYKLNGLPPGPIAMPGKSSLLAAVNPAKTGYLYYVARPDGSHAFAETLAEHNTNKEKYQQ
ncbi:MAG: endolytic transglycosylase MltG [Firmicutes bacterium]|nr:endolytic transglycosylase MltG [Bacillota bacterium]